MLKALFILACVLCSCGITYAADPNYSSKNDELFQKSTSARNEDFYRAPWGLAIGMRRADVPFVAENSEVYDVIPLLQYRNDYLFINDLEAGLHLWHQEQHQINLYSRFRFEDLPKKYQNRTQADGFDLGFQYRYTSGAWQSDLSLMTTGEHRFYGIGRAIYQWRNADWLLEPFVQFEWKNRNFNEAFYGLDRFDVPAGTSVSSGIIAKYHVTSNLYLLGQFGFNRLEDNIARLPIIDSQYQYETFLGFGFFPEMNKTNNSGENTDHYLDDRDQFVRIAHGWATPSNIGEIFTFQTKSDPYNNQLTSISYGTRLTKQLFDLPISLYFTPGFAWHLKSAVQKDGYEAFGAIKAIYTFELGPRWQFGIAEGLSYVNQLTYIEQKEMDEKGYRGSKLLNYLDFSLGVNVGDIFQSANLNQLWLGYSLHHRSGMFETSAVFGRIKGGSNYQTVYLQWDF